MSPQEGDSKRFIATSQSVAAFAAFAIAAAVPSAALAHRVWLFWIGLTAIIGGSLLRRRCWRMLGASFTGAVIVKPNQAIVDRGAYRYVRHLSYTRSLAHNVFNSVANLHKCTFVYSRRQRSALSQP